MAMISCVDCNMFLGNLPVEYGKRFLCGDCAIAKIDEIDAVETAALLEASETAALDESDCGC